eukprot:9192275-Pyramimonas_sp.AAC.1
MRRLLPATSSRQPSIIRTEGVESDRAGEGIVGEGPQRVTPCSPLQSSEERRIVQSYVRAAGIPRSEGTTMLK